MSSEKVVLDTNILVSGLLSSFGPPGRILDLALSGEVVVAYDDRILSEWREVLHREKFGFSERYVETLLDFLESEGLKVNSPPLGVELPDPDDVPFLEVAHAAGATLITGNTKHYPRETRQGAVVLDPASFLQRWTSKASHKLSGQEGNDG